uniref:Uncharacterized protein n=1 Tax=Heterorhabditis bacteriophora TaxID=37862 RepID=A0A1I7W936_HETBA
MPDIIMGLKITNIRKTIYTVRFKMIAHFVFLPFFCSLCWDVRALKISSLNFIAFHKKLPLLC